MKLVLGTMTFAKQVNQDSATQMLEMYIKTGFNELDTAYVYNEGETESLLGVIAGPDDAVKPARFSMASKAAPGGDPNRLSPKGISTQLETSLSRTKRKPVCYQGMYNAITRDVEKELFPCLKDYALAFYVYNPLAGGLLTGKYLRTTELPTNGRFSFHKGYPERYWKDSNMQGVSLVAEACQQENVTVAAAALRWLIHHSPLNDWKPTMEHAVVLGASTLEQLQENLSACAAGPLSAAITDQFEQAWKKSEPFCIKYFRP